MAALAGMRGNQTSPQIVEQIAQQIVHRGNDKVRRIEQGNILMQMGMNRFDRHFAPSLSKVPAIWDGIPPSTLDPATLFNWPSPFVVVAVVDDDLFIARDPLGVKPLYFGQLGDAFCFASEVKGLLQVTDDVNEFPPGHVYHARQGFQSYAKIRTGTLLDDDANAIAAELKRRLERAIQRYLVSETPGVWLSGGVDSSVIATLLKQQAGKVRSFVIGLPGASDLEYGAQVARILGVEHHSYTISFDDVLAALPNAIYALESFDALLVRSSVTHYLISKIASEQVEIIFTGEGGDELFAGYEYMKKYRLEEIPAVLEQAVHSLHNTAFQRVDRCASVHGLVPCFPFADMEVVEYALSIPPQYKLYQQSGRTIEKWILRRVIEGVLPDVILWRPKTKFWQGTGLQELMSRYAEERVTDRDFERERKLPNGWVLSSKEELMYYRIFREYFGKVSNLNWMGRTQVPTTADP